MSKSASEAVRSLRDGRAWVKRMEGGLAPCDSRDPLAHLEGKEIAPGITYRLVPDDGTFLYSSGPDDPYGVGAAHATAHVTWNDPPTGLITRLRRAMRQMFRAKPWA
jgi:hypothetical protein